MTKLRDKIIISLFAICLTGVLLYAIIGTLVQGWDYKDTFFDNVSTYESDWTLIREDGTSEEVRLPGSVEAKEGEIITIINTLPDNLQDNTYICFVSSKQDMDIFVDGKLIEHYTTEDTRFFGKASTHRYLWIKLSREESGKEISVVAHTESSYAGMFPYIYIGDPQAIFMMLLKVSGAEVLVGFLLLVFFIVLLLIFITFSIQRREVLNNVYLVIMGILAANWIVCDSHLRQFYLPSATIGNELAHLMLMLLPIPLLIYMDLTQKKRYSKFYVAFEIAAITNICVEIPLQVCNIFDFSEMLPVSAIIFGSSFVLIFVTLVVDIKNKSISDYPEIAIGMFASGILTIAQFIFYLTKVISFDGKNIAIALIILIGASSYATIRNMRKSEAEKAEAIALSKAESLFLANMSHEIRTPINAILGMDELILRGDISNEVREYAKDIQSAGQTLITIVNDVLDESRIRSGQMEIVPVDFSMNKLIHDIDVMFSYRASEKGLKLLYEVDDNLPDGYLGDDVRIRQVLNNLVSNSIKYTEEGGVRVTLNGKPQGDMMELTFEVADTGIGIRDEDKSQLFESFTRVDIAHNRNIEGTGLGLAITSSLIRMMGGELKFESSYGVGTRFYFSLLLPVCDTTTIAERHMGIFEELAGSDGDIKYAAPKAKILVADDNQLNLKVFCRLLAGFEMHIDSAVNGLEALTLTQNNKYDIIFLDHMMPVMDGVEALHQIRNNPSNLNFDSKIVVLTANAIGDAEERYLNEGFNAFISKPFVPEQLERFIVDMLPRELLIERTGDTVVYSQNSDDFTNKQDGSTTYIDGFELPYIENVDWQKAYANVTDVELLKDVLREFYSNARSETDELSKYYFSIVNGEDSAIDDYRIKVHAMKNTAALVGAGVLSEEAKKLEFAARDLQIDEVINYTENFVKHYLELAKDVAGIFNDTQAVTARKTCEPAFLLELVKVLREAMADFDINTLNDTMENIQSFYYEDELMVQVERLNDGVLMLDAELLNDAADRIAELLK